jgi:hypothetical protein
LIRFSVAVWGIHRVFRMATNRHHHVCATRSRSGGWQASAVSRTFMRP